MSWRGSKKAATSRLNVNETDDIGFREEAAISAAITDSGEIETTEEATEVVKSENKRIIT